MITDDYDREPLFGYTSTYSKAALYYEKPHELKDKTQGGAELKHTVWKVDGTWCVEYCVVQNLEPFLKAVKAFAWTGSRIFTQYEVTLESTALDDWKEIMELDEFSENNQNEESFLRAFQMLMQKIFNCVKQRDVCYRQFNRELVKKPKRLDPFNHEKRIRVMFRVQGLLKPSDQPEATEKQMRI